MLTRSFAAFAATTMLNGCGSTSRSLAPSATFSGNIQDLINAAKEEGSLNTIGLPPDFANYATIMRTFGTKHGLRVVQGSPNASSAEQLETIKALGNLSRAPDVIDIGPQFAGQAKDQRLVDPYMVSTWNTIPDQFKDPDGSWVADYWGVIAFGANLEIARDVPNRWSDLLDPKYRGLVALDGDPRESGSALAAVFAAALATGGSPDNIEPGIDLFADMKKAGNFIPVNATPATVLQGETPIMISWDYGLTALREEFDGKAGWEVSIPDDGVFGNYYCQAINKAAPHPYAARLWQEFLYSDEGQLLWLAGYAHPVRFEELLARGAIPKEMLEHLPPPSSFQTVTFPTAAQLESAKRAVQDKWAAKVVGP